MKHLFRMGIICVFSFAMSFILSGIVHAQEWARTYGGSNGDYAYSIQQTADGGYIVAGETHSSATNSYDARVLKLGYYAAQPASPAIVIHANGQRHGDDVAVLSPVDLKYNISDFLMGETCKEMFLILNAPVIGINWSYLNAQGQWLPLPQSLDQITPFGCLPGNGEFTLYHGDLPVGDYEIYMGIDLVNNGHLDLYNNNLIYDHEIIHVIK